MSQVYQMKKEQGYRKTKPQRNCLNCVACQIQPQTSQLTCDKSKWLFYVEADHVCLWHEFLEEKKLWDELEQN